MGLRELLADLWAARLLKMTSALPTQSKVSFFGGPRTLGKLASRAAGGRGGDNSMRVCHWSLALASTGELDVLAANQNLKVSRGDAGIDVRAVLGAEPRNGGMRGNRV